MENETKFSLDLNLSEAYIGDMLIINKGDWSNHLEKLELTLQKLKDNGFKCNIEKSSFGQTHMEYLRFWVPKTGFRPINKKYKPY